VRFLSVINCEHKVIHLLHSLTSLFFAYLFFSLTRIFRLHCYTLWKFFNISSRFSVELFCNRLTDDGVEFESYVNLQESLIVALSDKKSHAKSRNDHVGVDRIKSSRNFVEFFLKPTFWDLCNKPTLNIQ
jgi:hypothetical protein